MRRRTQANDLRAEIDRPIVAVTSEVIEGNVNGHVYLAAERNGAIGWVPMVPRRRFKEASESVSCKHRMAWSRRWLIPMRCASSAWVLRFRNRSRYRT